MSNTKKWVALPENGLSFIVLEKQVWSLELSALSGLVLPRHAITEALKPTPYASNSQTVVCMFGFRRVALRGRADS